jgi:hypothetical protein
VVAYIINKTITVISCIEFRELAGYFARNCSSQVLIKVGIPTFSNEKNLSKKILLNIFLFISKTLYRHLLSF